jgi:hypothetical protein
MEYFRRSAYSSVIDEVFLAGSDTVYLPKETGADKEERIATCIKIYLIFCMPLPLAVLVRLCKCLVSL